MRFFLAWIIIVVSTSFCFSQKTKLKIGYGFYEALNMGGYYSFSKTNEIGGALGYNFEINKRTYLAGILEYRRNLIRKNTNDNPSPFYLSGKLIYFFLEDNYYQWHVLSFVPSIGKEWSISQKISIAIDLGLAINNRIYSKRKSFEQVGWPYPFLPNAHLQLLYNLNSKRNEK